MAWQEPPVHRDYTPARLVLVVAITVVIVMALREHRDSVGGLVRAAEDVRMSTEHQQYSDLTTPPRVSCWWWRSPSLSLWHCGNIVILLAASSGRRSMSACPPSTSSTQI